MYDFNFDELTLGDFVIIGHVVANPGSTAHIAAFIEIMPKFTNTDVLNLPFTELKRIIDQFNEALAEHLKGVQLS